VVGGLVAEASLRGGNVKDAITLLAAAELARTGTELDFVIGKKLRGGIQEFPRRRRFARADVERPLSGRRRLERQINRPAESPTSRRCALSRSIARKTTAARGALPCPGRRSTRSAAR